ncbi:conserved exported hypothetical protein [Gammaproteobacteria bacterium]
MQKLRIIPLSVAVFSLAGCATQLQPNYTSTDPEQMRVGGAKPVESEPAIHNLGSYCLQVSEKWKSDSETPDGQTIWSKDTLRQVVPCRH